MSPRHKAVASLVAAMVLVGSSVAVGRILVASLPIHFASLVRFLLASLVLAPLVALGPAAFPACRGAPWPFSAARPCAARFCSPCACSAGCA